MGSTAILDLGGKSIIDIAIAVTKENMDGSSKILQKLGYQFRPSFSTPDRFYFIAYLSDPEEGSRRYHIHLTQAYSKEWKDGPSFALGSTLGFENSRPLRAGFPTAE